MSDGELSTALEAGNHQHNKGSKRYHYLPFCFVPGFFFFFGYVCVFWLLIPKLILRIEKKKNEVFVGASYKN